MMQCTKRNYLKSLVMRHAVLGLFVGICFLPYQLLAASVDVKQPAVQEKREPLVEKNKNLTEKQKEQVLLLAKMSQLKKKIKAVKKVEKKGLSDELKGIVQTLNQQFQKPLQWNVQVFKKNGSGTKLQERLSVSYLGSSKEASSLFEVKAQQENTNSSSEVSPIFSLFLKKFLSYPNIVEKLVSADRVAFKKNDSMPDVTKKIRVLPKTTSPYFKKAYLYMNEANEISVIELRLPQATWYYDLSGTMKI